MSQARTRREFLSLAPGAMAIALAVGAATGSTGPAGSSASLGPGTVNKIAKFLTANTIGDSALSDDGANVSSSESILPVSDNVISIGSPSLRIARINLSNDARIFTAVGDANPSARLYGGSLDFGAGGASAVDAYLKRISSALLETQAIRPQTDNVYDFGTLALRWRTAYAPIIDGGASVLTLRGGANSRTVIWDGDGFVLYTASGSDFGKSGSRWNNIYANVYYTENGIVSARPSGQNLSLGTDNATARFIIQSASPNALYPNSDNVQDLGKSGNRLANLYAVIMNSGASNLTLTPNSAVVPSADNVKDFGTTSLRWRTAYAPIIDGGASVLTLRGGTNSRTVIWDGDAFVLYTASGSDFGKSGSRWNNVYANVYYTENGIVSARPSGQNLSLGTDNATARFIIQSASPNALYPNSDNAQDLGRSGNRLANLYAVIMNSGASNLTLTPNAAVVPSADGTKDFGTSSLRFRDLYSSRRVIINSKNAIVLDGQSMTQSSHTVSNADTDIVTYSLGANSYTHVIVRVTGYVSFAALSTNQSINLKIKDGSTQVGNTMVVDGALSATASIPFTIEAVFVETSAVTLHITEGAAAADANTTVFVNSIVVEAES